MSEIEVKITELLERISRIFKVLQWEISKEYKISPIQIQFLIYIDTHPLEFCNVSSLSKEYYLKPSTVSDAISSLVKKEFLQKQVNLKDKRSYSLKTTIKGKEILKKILSWDKKIEEAIQGFSHREKEEMYGLLLLLVKKLQEKGFFQSLRICFTCKNLEEKNGKTPVCKLTGQKIPFGEIKVDCLLHKINNIK